MLANKTKNSLFICCFLSVVSFSIYSQSSTRSQSNELTVKDEKSNVQHKILLIPFEPRLLMCEIGKNIAKETNMSYSQITNTFRNGLEFSLITEIRKNFSTVSLLADSNMTYKDINYIYESIGYSYDLVPGEANTKNTTAGKKDEKDVHKTGIQNGQIVVEANEDKRFMNTKISNKELLGYLNKKYETDLFLFINQLDIKNVPSETFDINSNGFDREITVHYTLLDKTGNPINAGISTNRFSSQLNDPKRITTDHLSVASRSISDKILITLVPPKPEEKKKDNHTKTGTPEKVK